MVSYRYACLNCAVANNGRPTTLRLCFRCDPGSKTLRAEAKFQKRAEQRRIAVLKALREERIRLEAEEARSAASEASGPAGTVTTAAKPKSAEGAGMRPITSFLAKKP